MQEQIGIARPVVVSGTSGTRRLARALAAILFAGLGLLLPAVALVKPLDHDEQMYVAAADLLRRGAGLPYRDFHFFQMPNLELGYAALFLLTDHLLLAARLLNAALAVGSLAILFALVWRRFQSAGYFAALAAGAAPVALVVGNGPFTFAAGLAWNHDLPVLLTLLAVSLFPNACEAPGDPSGTEQGTGERGQRDTSHDYAQPVAGMGTRRTARLVLAGAALGLAIGARLAFAPAVLPFLLAAALPGAGEAGQASDQAPARRAAWRRGPGVLAAGVLLGLAPVLALATPAPQAFLFDNLTYHLRNAAYWQAAGQTVAMSLPGKLAYMGGVLRDQPACLALLAVYALFALPALVTVLRRGRVAVHGDLLLATMLAPCLLAGALVPTPTWYQYFYAPVPFMALAATLGLGALSKAAIWRRGRWGLIALWIAAGPALVNGAQVYAGYLRDGAFLQPAGWVPVQAHRAGEEIRQLLDTRGTPGAGRRVLTLAPLYPLEGGLEIYPALAAGPFAWRVAPLLSAAQRRAFAVVGSSDLDALVGTDAPVAVLTGAEGGLEDALTGYAQAHGYHPAPLSNGLTVWLK
jgi:hypothetical protein